MLFLLFCMHVIMTVAFILRYIVPCNLQYKPEFVYRGRTHVPDDGAYFRHIDQVCSYFCLGSMSFNDGTYVGLRGVCMAKTPELEVS